VEIAELAVVGLGHGSGEDVTLAGDAALAASGWIGFYGLPPALAAFLGRYAGTARVDLDRSLDAERLPAGFTARLADAAFGAARGFGRAAVAVAGHPSFGNPATRVLLARAAAAGVRVRLYGGASALDAYAQRTGRDPLEAGSALVDARVALRDEYRLDPRLDLVCWNAAYLDGAQRAALARQLACGRSPDAPLHLFRSGAHGRPGEVAAYPLADAERWARDIDYETTLIVPAPP